MAGDLAQWRLAWYRATTCTSSSLTRAFIAAGVVHPIEVDGVDPVADTVTFEASALHSGNVHWLIWWVDNGELLAMLAGYKQGGEMNGAHQI